MVTETQTKRPAPTFGRSSRGTAPSATISPAPTPTERTPSRHGWRPSEP